MSNTNNELKDCSNSNCEQNNPQPLSNFYFRKDQNKYGKQCKSCKAEYSKNRYEKNKDKIKAKNKEYRENNPEKEKERHRVYNEKNEEKVKLATKEYNARPEIKERKRIWVKENPEKNKKSKRKWAKNNRDKANKQRREYRKNNPEKVREQESKPKRMVSGSLRVQLNKVIHRRLNGKPYEKNGSAVKDLGCSVDFLIVFLEVQFYPHPITGEMMTWENYGSLWHIDHIIPFAAFDVMKNEDIKRVCHYTNLQPLWAEENLQKGAKIPKEFGKDDESQYNDWDSIIFETIKEYGLTY